MDRFERCALLDGGGHRRDEQRSVRGRVLAAHIEVVHRPALPVVVDAAAGRLDPEPLAEHVGHRHTPDPAQRLDDGSKVSAGIGKNGIDAVGLQAAQKGLGNRYG